MHAAETWIKRLNLRPHPEGGFFRETYRAAESVAADQLPPRFGGARSFSTAIYFLLGAGHFSAFHRIKADEIWHFYAGGPLDLYVIQPDGQLITQRLGLNVEHGELPQRVIPANHWFAARPAPASPYTLVGCTVAPGFDFADFELATTTQLAALFPQHKTIIATLTTGHLL
jgi:predicted cupin superfamily sugar epimerase